MSNKETLLKKEFKESDLTRIRNLVQKKYGEKTKTQIGFQQSKEDHIEGDIWKENSKTWTIKNGIKMTVSKLDLVKKSLQLPLTCPCCGKAMKNKKLDSKMYSIHKKCFDCVLDYETQLRFEGKYEEYTNTILKQNTRLFIEQVESDLNDFIKDISSNEVIINENGESEEWNGKEIDIKKIKQDIQEYIGHLKEIHNI